MVSTAAKFESKGEMPSPEMISAYLRCDAPIRNGFFSCTNRAMVVQRFISVRRCLRQAKVCLYCNR